ncbi:hypothetical protein CONCODRAFT_4954 [Conidiobolus coronatus NRRL 28638]|uniref:G-protein coupled receptors family 1 profile domain-containing protein n=1 Tax=Conidiobolus coronatus (strain ATCC 28846 / CBS 209.66 / NRRL 28638) TaxID=796925 RepID=A0A137PB32_CONC2|nr:hypothetical protein CONCODRAFT_4954 [Conidiobolus coronatus NRRL 28638]|eukprot:KXN72209.1 hypothetical protein CONCODRAFT_4954 [Conidiobolus coronatus NRRL 28638]
MDYYKIRELAYPYNYVVSIAAIFLSISGTTLNTLVLHIILKNKWKKLSIDLKLICFTLLFDLLSCFYIFTTGICNLVGYADYLNSKFSCTINSIISIFTCVTSINIVGVVSLERYFLIVKEKVLCRKVYYMLILSIQLVNLISCIIGGVFGGFSISATSVFCMFNLNSWAGIAGDIILILSVGTSINITYFSYINIIIKRRKLTLQNQKIFPFKSKKIKREANSTIIKSVLIIIASTFTNIPFNVLLFIALVNPKFLTPQIQAICSTFTMLNMIINALIVLRLRTDIWNEFKEVIFIKNDNSEADGSSIDDYQLADIEVELNNK